MADLEDFESYLDPDFNASKFSNDLICATNEADTDELDIGTSMKKLKFDIQECDKRMTSIASSNHEPLVAICSQVGPTKDYANETLKPLVDRLVSAFDKIKSGILVPYEEALESNQALKRLHSTLDLLRRTSYFLFLIQQFDELNQDGDRDDVRLGKLYLQLGQLVCKVGERLPIYILDVTTQLHFKVPTENFRGLQPPKYFYLHKQGFDIQNSGIIYIGFEKGIQFC